MEIGRYPNKLKMFRHACGYSRKKVARMLGLADTSTISRWEHGVSLPGTVQVFRLARLYGMMPHELLLELWNQQDCLTNLLAQDIEPFNSNESVLI